MNPRPKVDSKNRTESFPLVWQTVAAATVSGASTLAAAGNRSSASTGPISAA